MRDPKHSPPKVPGQSESRAANNLKVSPHSLGYISRGTRGVPLNPGPCQASGLQPGEQEQ